MWEQLQYYLGLYAWFAGVFYISVVLLCGIALFWFYRLVRFTLISAKVGRILRKAPKGSIVRNRHCGAWVRGRAKKIDFYFDAGNVVYAVKYYSVQPLGRKLVFSSRQEWLLEKKLIAQKAFQAAGYQPYKIPEFDIKKDLPQAWKEKECRMAYLFCPAPASFCRYADREGEVYALQEIYGFVILTPSTLARFLKDPSQIQQSTAQKKRFFEE